MARERYVPIDIETTTKGSLLVRQAADIEVLGKRYERPFSDRLRHHGDGELRHAIELVGYHSLIGAHVRPFAIPRLHPLAALDISLKLGLISRVKASGYEPVMDKQRLNSRSHG
jgi:hypothetical protein